MAASLPLDAESAVREVLHHLDRIAAAHEHTAETLDRIALAAETIALVYATPDEPDDDGDELAATVAALAETIAYAHRALRAKHGRA